MISLCLMEVAVAVFISVCVCVRACVCVCACVRACVHVFMAEVDYIENKLAYYMFFVFS